MICREIPVSITPTPKELAYGIWHMCSDGQAETLLALSRIYDEKTFDFLMQLTYINDVINEELFWEDKQKIIHMFESILKYLKESEEEL